MMKMRDVIIIADDDDDEVRTMRQQQCVLRNSSSGLSIYSSLLISAMSCKVRAGYRWSWLSFCSQPNLHMAEKGFKKLHEFFTITYLVTGEDV
jgi:hypothetical protein